MEIDEQYLRELLAQRSPAKKRGSPFDLLFLLAVVGSLLFALAVKGPELLVTYGVVPVEQMCAWLNVECPELTEGQQAPPTAPTAKAITVTTFGGGGGGSGSALRTSLPDCSTVTDTTTACINTSSAAPVRAQAEQPTGTPEPAYVTETCLTPPGERPCWLAADQPWEPLAEVPATPIVLLPEATSVPLVFADSACAAWRPPLPWPEGCEDE